MTHTTQPASTPSGLDARRMRILVTDDEPRLRSVIGEFLEAITDCLFAEAGDGLEALEYLRANPVDCLLSDIKMPRMDLEQLLGHVAQEFPGVIVIATSGNSDVDTARRIFELGAHDFLAKPLDLDLLEQALSWIPSRERILNVAIEIAGAEAGNGGLEPLRAVLREETGPYAGRMRHALRVADLVALVAEEDDPARSRELELAALLHEVGVSNQHWLVMSEPRALTAGEIQMVRTGAHIGGRLLERALPGRLAGRIVRGHLAWAEENAAAEAGWNDLRHLSCLLGVLNAVDALQHDRPDRAALSAEQVKAQLKAIHSQTGLSEVERVLCRWNRIEAFYSRMDAA